MKRTGTFETTALGQVGYRFRFGPTVLYIDPYLSHYVEEVEGPELRRLFPLPCAPESIRDAAWILLTHAHIDHCDPQTLGPLAGASPGSRFLGPAPVLDVLRQQGIADARLHLAPEGQWTALDEAVNVTAVPAVHPTVERDGQGRARSVGYVLEYAGRRIYHAGDTSIADELMGALKALAPIDVAFLPVNERNYFRDRRGIIGNMTVREAFGLAGEIGATVLVPTHFDMFALNSVTREEIELLHAVLKPGCALRIYPSEL